MEKLSCAQVLKSLWRQDSILYAKVLIPNILFLGPQSNIFLWLFTDQQGFIKKKSHINSNSQQIVHFLFPNYREQKHNNRNSPVIKPDTIGGFQASGPQLHELTTAQLIHKIQGSGIGQKDALIILPQEKKAVNFIRAEVRREKLGLVHKIYKDYNGMKIAVQSIYLQTIKKISQAIITSIEKNRFKVVQNIFLLFFQSQDRLVYFIGTSKCYVKSKVSIPSIPPHLQSHRILPRRKKVAKKCQGSFCNCIIKSKARISATDMDYDDLLQEVKHTYFSSSDRKLEKTKQSLRVERLQQEIKDEKLVRIPYKYILIGKEFIQRSSIDLKKPLLEINLRDFIRAFSSIEVEEHMSSLVQREYAVQNPFRFYATAQVCFVCYQIYIIIKYLQNKKAKELKFLRKKPKRTKLEIDRSENLDLLLNDMNYDLFILKYGKQTNEVYQQFYSETEKPKVVETPANRFTRKLRKRTVYLKDKLENDDNQFQNLKNKLFPDDFKVLKSPGSNKQWRQYIRKLKNQEIQSSQA